MRTSAGPIGSFAHLAGLIEQESRGTARPRSSRPSVLMPATASDSRMIRLRSWTSAMSTSPGCLGGQDSSHPPVEVGQGTRPRPRPSRREPADEVGVAPDVVVEHG